MRDLLDQANAIPTADATSRCSETYFGNLPTARTQDEVNAIGSQIQTLLVYNTAQSWL